MAGQFYAHTLMAPFPPLPPENPLRAKATGFEDGDGNVLERRYIMENDSWLVGWKAIGGYIGRSAKTARLWAKDGMPFFRDHAGRPIAKPSMLDEFIVELNQSNFEDKTWRDKGIRMALLSEEYKEKQRKEFDEKLLAAQRPPRSRF